MSSCTCQICGREIKANSGVIAHHGYRRPGQGWQTRSCMGARYKSYEVACDALPLAIRGVEEFLVSKIDQLDSLLSAPPAEFTVESRSGKVSTIARPADFNMEDYVYQVRSSMPRTYENEHHGRVLDLRGHIKAGREQLAFLKARLAAWVAPAAPEAPAVDVGAAKASLLALFALTANVAVQGNLF